MVDGSFPQRPNPPDHRYKEKMKGKKVKKDNIGLENSTIGFADTLNLMLWFLLRF